MKQLHLIRETLHRSKKCETVDLREKYIFKENKDPKIFDRVKYLRSKLNSLIESNKQKYYSGLSKKFADPKFSRECYWPAQEIILNDKTLLVFRFYATDCEEMAEIFNSFFTEKILYDK